MTPLSEEIVEVQPANAFDNFSYDVQDESIDDLKQDLIALDNSVNNGLLVKYNNGKSSTSELAMRDIYQKFSDKLGLKVGYSNFRDCVEHIAENNKVQRDILEAVNAKIAIDISQRAIAKLMITFNTLIDRATTMILKATESCEVEDFSPELIGMCDRCIQWLNQLEEIKEKASSKISDPDRAITRIMEQAQAKLGIKSINNINSIEYSPELLNDLLDSLAKEYEK